MRASVKPSSKVKSRPVSRGGRGRRYLPYLLFLVFAALLVAGLAFDEFRSVWVNAATICLSCIGIQ